MCFCHRGGQWHFGLHVECCHLVKGSDPSLQISTGEATSGLLCLVLGSSVQARHGHTGDIPKKAQKSVKELEPLSSEEKLRNVNCSAWRTFRGDLINLYLHLKWRCTGGRARLFSVVPRTQAAPSQDQEGHVYFEGDWALEQVFQRGCSLRPWRYSKSTWSKTTSYSLSRGWTRGPPEIPWNLSHSVNFFPWSWITKLTFHLSPDHFITPTILTFCSFTCQTC